jgi:hypothetical protein
MSTREAVCAEALTWVGTPFHDCADVKGAGVDCAMLLVRIYCGLGIAPHFDPRPYKPQWFEHQDDPIYLNWLRKYSHQVSEPEAGDIAMFQFGKQAAHGAVVIEPGRSMVHAFKPSAKVIFDDLRHLRPFFHSYWSPF